MNSPQNVLILDDEPGFRTEIAEYLTDDGFQVFPTGLPSEALEIVKKNKIDIGVFDIRLPEIDGLTFLQKIKKQFPDIDVIMMTGYGEVPIVISALRFGAADFLTKPFKLTELRETIDRVAKYKSMKTGPDSQDAGQGAQSGGYNQLTGVSKAFREIQSLIKKIALSGDATVLISGESGTGKELIAKAIHDASPRKDKKFIPVNCSTIPEELFENEFFGHFKGSYTDAKYDQKGLFEVADKGTLFLDEIGDLKYSMQAKLLRVIEEKKISRLGEYREKEVDVRIIAATNQDIEAMIKSKQFRADLFHRLNIFRINVTPLRERKEDIPILFNYYVEYYSGKYNKPVKKIEKSVVPKIMNYSFPGNVRELKNMVERAIILCENENLTEKYFNLPEILPTDDKLTNSEHSGFFDLNMVKKESIQKALQQTGYNKSKAALLLNISRQALDRKMKKLNIYLFRKE